MTDIEAPLQSERKRGSGAKMVYDLLRDEILNITCMKIIRVIPSSESHSDVLPLCAC